MTCKDLHSASIESGSTSPLYEEAADHVSHCSHCRRLLKALSPSEAGAQPSSASLDQIATMLATDLRPVRPIAAKKYTFITLVAIVVGVVALSVARMGALAIPVMSSLQTYAILGSLAVSIGLSAYSLVNQIVPGSRHRISPRLLPLTVSIFLMLLIAVVFPFRPEPDFWTRSWSCIRVGTIIGVLAALPLWLVLRRGAILSPAITGTAIGFFAGLAALTTLEIHCPNIQASHVLVGHLGVVILCAVTGLLLGTTVEGRLKGFLSSNFSGGACE